MLDTIAPDNVDQFLDYLEEVLIPQWEIEAKPGRLADDDWDILRCAVLKRDLYHCLNCGAFDVQLDVHHIVMVASGGSNRLSNLTTLCHDCHALIHEWLS